MVQRIFNYSFAVTMAIMAYIVCSPSVGSKSSAIKKCKQLYENHHDKLNAIADFWDRFEFKDSSCYIHIRGSDGVITLNMADTTIKNENILPDKIYRICRELHIAEFKSTSSENYIRLTTGAFSNSDFDIDICLLKNGRKEFNIPNEDELITNRDEEGNFNYILGPYENVLFYSKAVN